MSQTGAQLLVAGLEAAGVEVVFGLPGVHNLAAWEALRVSPIRLVTVRHEQTAAYAADGYARTTGRVVVAIDVRSGLKKPGVMSGMLHETDRQERFFVPVTKEQRVVATAASIGVD